MKNAIYKSFSKYMLKKKDRPKNRPKTKKANLSCLKQKAKKLRKKLFV